MENLRKIRLTKRGTSIGLQKKKKIRKQNIFQYIYNNFNIKHSVDDYICFGACLFQNSKSKIPCIYPVTPINIHYCGTIRR